jgi:hypothetical protein
VKNLVSSRGGLACSLNVLNSIRPTFDSAILLLTMSSPTLEVNSDQGREGYAAATVSTASGAPPAASTAGGAAPENEPLIQARAIETHDGDHEDGSKDDGGLDPSARRKAVATANGAKDDLPASDKTGVAPPTSLENGDARQDDKDGKVDVQERSEEPLLPIGSRGAQEPLTDYM